ncbi:hypothetical protein [Methylovirgula sp. 4M-Z18]|uniref:hypothetical protein n=1 Tax=Methylovirgula sp. 4M-Z18 TaxID=2293567 RepID=UPI000E370C46|nr:hypothetical protein [Methylovirgula sp. 4M-Z18]RFB81079.1 hypothetical protein DYH55_06380 [Methylovirgula sp. 4M-Z18]
MIVLLIPALVNLLFSGQRTSWADFFALATAVWIPVAAMFSKGTDALFTAAGGESLEFLGAYMVGRAFLWHPAALRNFLNVLKFVIIVLFFCALADRISGQWIIENSLASFVNIVPAGANYREGVVRATATLDHPILLGAFFALASALFIYSNMSTLSRAFFLLVCLFGSYLSLSSVSLMVWCMILGVYLYDQFLSAVSRRWTLFWGATFMFICLIVATTNAPLGWIITHMTWDPESGYFRYLIWNAALERIHESPYIGFAFSPLNDDILDTTIDSVWLASALRFGVPMIVWLFLTNLAAIWPTRKIRPDLDDAAFLKRMNTGFAVMLLMFMFIGLTVHFWNYMWVYWALCLGIKTSLRQNLAGNKG